MSGPFEHYPVSPDVIDEAGQDINATAGPMLTVATEAATQVAEARAQTDGFLGPLIAALSSPLVQTGRELRAAAAFAGSVTRVWAVAVRAYNASVDDLNREYAAAKARGFDVAAPEMRGGQTQESRDAAWDRHATDVRRAGDAKLAELARRRDELDDDLDETAADLAGRLDRGPSDGDWAALAKAGVLPDAFSDLVPTPERPEVPDGPAWYETAFKTFIFDTDQFGEGGSFWGGAIEIAGIIPVGKVLKGGKIVAEGVDAAGGAKKLSKAEQAIEDAKDAQKAWDKADDARRAASASRRELGDMFTEGKVPAASALRDYAERQGWKLRQTENGPPTYIDENGIKRVTIKKGSPRTPGSENPHVEMRDSTGQRVDPEGNPVTRNSPDNHRDIDWDLD